MGARAIATPSCKELVGSTGTHMNGCRGCGQRQSKKPDILHGSRDELLKE